MLVQRKGQYAIEVYVLEPHRRQVTGGLTVHLPLAGQAPTIQRGLHLMGIPGHDEVGHERQRTGLGPSSLRAARVGSGCSRGGSAAVGYGYARCR